MPLRQSQLRQSVYFITGTDTGVGKTIATCLLARHLRARGVAVAALKPLCSGARADARQLCDSLNGTLTLDEINPWHFRAPLSPLIAARREQRRVTLAQVVTHVRRMQERFAVVLVEGAGGLLSPLGPGFDSRVLIEQLEAIPIIVCPNRLGAINQARLAVDALRSHAAATAKIALVSPRVSDRSAESNTQFLRAWLGAARVQILPWLKSPVQLDRALRNPRLRRALDALVPDA